MKTSRKDVERNKQQTRCPNSLWLGFSSSKLKYGDSFVYKYPNDETLHYAKCHGRIKARFSLNPDRKDGKWHILAQTMSNNMQFSMERWIEPECVVEVIPKDRINPHLAELFLEYEKNNY